MASTQPNRFGAAVAKRQPTSPTPGPAGETQRKYTVLLSNSVAMNLDEDMVTLSRTVGRKVDKSEVLRTLAHLLHTDPGLLDQVAARLK